MEAMEISLPWCLGPVIKGHENSLVASYDLDVIITAEVRISRHEFDRGRSTIRCRGEIHAVKANEKQRNYIQGTDLVIPTNPMPPRWYWVHSNSMVCSDWPNGRQGFSWLYSSCDFVMSKYIGKGLSTIIRYKTQSLCIYALTLVLVPNGVCTQPESDFHNLRIITTCAKRFVLEDFSHLRM